MDNRAFDCVRLVADQLTSRRGVFGHFAGAGIVATLAGREYQTRAKKQKPKPCTAPRTRCGKKGCCGSKQMCVDGVCLERCRFIITPTRKTLKQDCLTRRPIKIRDGVTFDGDGHTIFMEGTADTLPYGVGGVGGTAHVRNLTLDGSKLTNTSGFVRGVGIRFGNASGTIKNSTLTGFSKSSGDAILVLVSGGSEPQHTVAIDNVAIDDSQVGINVSAINKLTLEVTDCDIRDVNFGIQVQYNVEATVEDNDIAANTYGVVAISSAAVDAAPDVTATDNRVTGAQIGMSVAADFSQPGTAIPSLVANGNTIVGPGATSAGATHGLAYNKLAAGSANNNRISNFFDSRGNVGCGIFVAADAGAVNIGAGNTFPPPGNEQDICDN